MNIIGNLRIEVQGPNSLVLDQADQIWCLQMNNDLGTQRCEEYIAAVAQIELELEAT